MSIAGTSLKLVTGGAMDDCGAASHPLLSVRRLPTGHSLVRVSGRLTGEGAAGLRRLAAAEVGSEPAQLVVELSGVTEIDGAGMDALTALAELAGEADVALCLIGAHEGPVAAALNEAGHSELFEIFPSADDI